MSHRFRILLSALAAVLAAVLVAGVVPAAAERASSSRGESAQRDRAGQKKQAQKKTQKDKAKRDRAQKDKAQREKAQREKAQREKARQENERAEKERAEQERAKGERDRQGAPATMRLACGRVEGGVRCEWSRADAAGAAGYRLWRATRGEGGEPRVVHATRDLSATTHVDGQAQPEQAYAYRVEALDAQGRPVQRSENQPVGEQGRPAPMKLACARDGETGPVGCRWSASDNAAFAGYRLWRASAERSPSGEVRKGEPTVVFRTADRSVTSHRDAGADLASGHVYRVEAVDAEGRVLAASDGAGVRPANGQPPEKASMRLACAPAAEGDSRAVACRWSRSEAPGFAAYRLWRKTGDAEPVVIATVRDREATGHLDRDVAAGQRYAYGVEAIDAEGRTLGRSQPVGVACCEPRGSGEDSDDGRGDGRDDRPGEGRSGQGRGDGREDSKRP